MLDSLVRVSRRVDENHFVSITTHATTRLELYPRMAETQNFSVPPHTKEQSPNLKVYSAQVHWRVLMGIEPRNSSI